VDAPSHITLRFAFPDDAEAVARLAVIDSAQPPPLPALLAEVEGVLWAALSLGDGSVVADPFRPTAAVVELLQARAQQLQRAESAQRRPSRSWRWAGLGSRLGV